MSIAWNFPIFMLNARVEKTISPQILHFMSQPKPWEGSFPPWGRTARAPYLETVRLHPELARYCGTTSLSRWFRYHLQQRYKKTLETVTWARGVKRERILAYEGWLKGQFGPL